LEFIAGIEPHIGCDPKLSIEARRLTFILRFASSAQHRMAQSDWPIAPDLSSIWPAIRQKVSQRPQERPIHGRAIAIENADDCAQCVCVSNETSGLSNGAKC
jgi:hypothetical protein